MALTLRTDETLDNALSQLSELTHASKQEVIRQAVMEKLEREVHSCAVDTGIDYVLGKWAPALNRLSQA